jgi:hypothetical protein
MAGDSEKKAAARRAKAQLYVVGLIVAVNASFFLFRSLSRAPLLASWRELAALVTCMAAQAVCGWLVVNDRAAGGRADGSTDVLALALFFQFAAIWDARAWYGALLIPLYGAYLGVTAARKTMAVVTGFAQKAAFSQAVGALSRDAEATKKTKRTAHY